MSQKSVTPCKASWDRLLVALKPFRVAAGPEGVELREALDGHFPGVDWEDGPEPGDNGDHAFVTLTGSQWLGLVQLLGQMANLPDRAEAHRELLRVIRDESRRPTEGWPWGSLG